MTDAERAVKSFTEQSSQMVEQSLFERKIKGWNNSEVGRGRERKALCD
jgi:hypothetical protein